MTSWPESNADVLMGVGGTPEAVLAACALRCMGGNIQGKLVARTPDELERGLKMGYNPEKTIFMDDLIHSEDVFFAATGLTDGELLHGIDYSAEFATTDSLVMRGPHRNRAPDQGHSPPQQAGSHQHNSVLIGFFYQNTPPWMNGLACFFVWNNRGLIVNILVFLPEN